MAQAALKCLQKAPGGVGTQLTVLFSSADGAVLDRLNIRRQLISLLEWSHNALGYHTSITTIGRTWQVASNSESLLLIGVEEQADCVI